MTENERKNLIVYLSQYITPHKIRTVEKVLRNRTRYVTLILEDIHKEHNASATLRTCEALGIQDVHIIENTTHFTINKDVTLGSSKWISLNRYKDKHVDNTRTCLHALREKGYKIIATTPNAHSLPLEDLPFDGKFALLFGNEESGLSDCALECADEQLKLPMYGFTASYNISVSVGIALSFIIDKLRSSDIPWQLTDREKSELTLSWYRKIVRASDLLEEAYIKQQKKQTSC